MCFNLPKTAICERLTWSKISTCLSQYSQYSLLYVFWLSGKMSIFLSHVLPAKNLLLIIGSCDSCKASKSHYMHRKMQHPLKFFYQNFDHWMTTKALCLQNLSQCVPLKAGTYCKWSPETAGKDFLCCVTLSSRFLSSLYLSISWWVNNFVQSMLHDTLCKSSPHETYQDSWCLEEFVGISTCTVWIMLNLATYLPLKLTLLQVVVLPMIAWSPNQV